jgi:hypothetical protein
MWAIYGYPGWFATVVVLSVPMKSAYKVAEIRFRYKLSVHTTSQAYPENEADFRATFSLKFKPKIVPLAYSMPRHLLVAAKRSATFAARPS